MILCNTKIESITMKKTMMQPTLEELTILYLNILEQLLKKEPFEIIKQKLSNKQQNNLNFLLKCGALTINSSGDLIGAYPLSPRPTQYKIILEELGKGYAMCAIDALGVAFTFNKRTIIETIDSATGDFLRMAINPDLSEQQPVNIFVQYKQVQSCCNAAMDQCPYVVFTSKPENAVINSSIKILTYKEAVTYAKKRFSHEGIKQSLQSIIDEKCYTV